MLRLSGGPVVIRVIALFCVVGSHTNWAIVSVQLCEERTPLEDLAGRAERGIRDQWPTVLVAVRTETGGQASRSHAHLAEPCAADSALPDVQRRQRRRAAGEEEQEGQLSERGDAEAPQLRARLRRLEAQQQPRHSQAHPAERVSARRGVSRPGAAPTSARTAGGVIILSRERGAGCGSPPRTWRGASSSARTPAAGATNTSLRPGARAAAQLKGQRPPGDDTLRLRTLGHVELCTACRLPECGRARWEARAAPSLRQACRLCDQRREMA